MPTIAATNNLAIRIEDNSWSLLNGRADEPVPIVEATSAGLSYKPAFATARHLSPDGSLGADKISMVVVGWAVEDSSWHLGLMFTPEIAKTRGGRWCGLARWNNHDGDNAAQAGEALASALGKPFRLVPPPDAGTPQTASPAQEAEPLAPVQTPLPPAPEMQPTMQPMPNPMVQPMTEGYAPSTPTGPATPPAPYAPIAPATPALDRVPPVPMMDLPISIGEWTINGDEDILVWQHSRGWRNKTLLNVGFFAALTLVFAALSIGARTSVFAPVQPDWLPLVGLALTVLMVILMAMQLLTLFRSSTVVVDNHERFVRVVQGYRKGSSRNGRVLIQSPFEGIEYVLVSQVLTRRDSNESGPLVSDLPSYDRFWPEVWVHLYSPRRGFISVCYVNQAEGRILSGLAVQVRRALDLREIDTPVHQAALRMADMIGVPAYVESR